MVTNTWEKWIPFSVLWTQELITQQVRLQKNVTNSDKSFLSNFYRNPINQYKRPRFKVGKKGSYIKKWYSIQKRL